MSADVLVTPGARASADMILTWFSWIIQEAARERVKDIMLSGRD